MLRGILLESQTNSLRTRGSSYKASMSGCFIEDKLSEYRTSSLTNLLGSWSLSWTYGLCSGTSSGPVWYFPDEFKSLIPRLVTNEFPHHVNWGLLKPYLGDIMADKLQSRLPTLVYQCEDVAVIFALHVIKS